MSGTIHAFKEIFMSDNPISGGDDKLNNLIGYFGVDDVKNMLKGINPEQLNNLVGDFGLDDVAKALNIDPSKLEELTQKVDLNQLVEMVKGLDQDKLNNLIGDFGLDDVMGMFGKGGDKPQ
jgi:hypothetical protein